MKADKLPPRQKQRHVQQDGQQSHRQLRHQDIDHLGKARDAGHGHLVGDEKHIKRQAKEDRTDSNDQVIQKQLFFHRHHSSRPSCCSSESSSRTRAPAAGTARTR